MLRKRLIGTVTIRNGWAVQSFGYQKYLPVGKPECIVENLDRWGVDEIFLQVMDRSLNNLGPDIDLIEKIANSGISTPLVYAGGIRTEEDAVKVIRAGADRICLDALLHTNPEEVRKIAHRLGGQAVIASIPLVIAEDGIPQWYNYQSKKTAPMGEGLLNLFKDGVLSEALLIDSKNEGQPNSFDFRLLSMFSEQNIPLILFGGLSEPEQLEKALMEPRVSATAVGNFLNYREHAVQKLKTKLAATPVRPAFYCEKSLG
jgi:cyclase